MAMVMKRRTKIKVKRPRGMRRRAAVKKLAKLKHTLPFWPILFCLWLGLSMFSYSDGDEPSPPKLVNK